MIAAVLGIMLSGCGQDGKVNTDDTKTAGGAVTKVTQSTEAAGEKTETSKQEEEKPAEETKAPEEDEPELSQVYEGSYTQKFAEVLDKRDFSAALSFYITDGDEGMELERTDSYDIKGDGAHYRSTAADGNVTEQYYIPEGLYGVNDDGSVSPINESPTGSTGTEDMIFTVMGIQPDAELVSAESFSDGTVREVVVSDSIERTLVFDGDTGYLISVEAGNEYRTVDSFKEGIDEIGLPEGTAEIVP